MQKRFSAIPFWLRASALSLFYGCCALLTLAFFLPKEIIILGQPYPLWFCVGVIATAGVVSASVVSILFGYQLRLLLAILFMLPLTIVQVRALEADQLSATSVWASVLWSMAICEILFAWRSQLLNKKQWRLMFLGTLMLTGIVALQQRMQLAVAFYPLIIFIGSFFWIIVLRAAVSLFPNDEQSTAQRALPRRWDPWLIALAAVVLCGAWLRIATIDQFGFENDEYYHLNTGMGYAQTGEYVQWNFLTQQPEEPREEYTRAWPYTWQVAQSITLFGVSEWSVRLPALVWGLVLLVLLPLVVRSFTKSWSIAFFATLFLAFDDGYIWLSSYTRMYSMFFVLVLASIWAFWHSVRASHDRTQPPLVRVITLLLSILFAGIATVIHQSGFLLFVGMAATALLHLLRDPQSRWYRLLTAFFACAGALGLIVHFFIHPFLPPTFFIIRKNPSLSYFEYMTQNMILPWAAAALGLTAVTQRALRKTPSWILVIAGTTFPFLLYFVYFAPRYAARKYSLFFILLFFICIAAAWRWLWQHAAPTKFQWLSVALFIWFFVEVSFPGVSASIVFTTSRADKTISDILVQDYREGYLLLERSAGTGDAVVLLAPRTYYLRRTDLRIFEIPTRTDMTIDDLTLILAHNSRGWIVWPKFKNYHLSNELKNYIRKNFIAFTESDPTNMVMYRWDKTTSIR